MNLSEALNAALPEIPARLAGKGVPRLDPAIVGREQMEEGQAVIIAHRPKTSQMYHFTPDQWAILQLFDGERSYEQIAELSTNQLGIAVTENDIREFADLISTTDCWYRSAQEKNIALMQKLAEERRKHTKKKSKHGDVAHIQFSAWDPDEFLTRAYEYARWVYTPWFTTLTLLAFAFMTYVFIGQWGEIGRDTLKYYTFTEKSLYDLAEFWLLFLVIGFFHECAHGVTCKHYGGGVHRMGFHLIYLSPAFFVDVTEGWVYANRWQRLVTIIAGIWMELIFCAAATIIYWGTTPGTFTHEFAYKVMLITGVAVVVVNLNPLIKLDGYYFFSEMFDIQDIKERSTAYVSGMVKKHFWKLPVEVDFVPRRLRWYFVPYSLLSGLYSYSLLLIATIFLRNVFAKFVGPWAFVPALFMGWLIFRSRIRTMVRFMHTVYLDKRPKLRAFMHTPYAVFVGAGLLVLLFAPVWPDHAEGRFVLEPSSREVLRAHVPGRVVSIHAGEGQWVNAGEPLATMQNLQLESAAQQRAATLQSAALRSQDANFHMAGFAAAEQQRQAAAQDYALARQQLADLDVVPSVSGTVLTPHVEDKVGSYLKEGELIAEVADLRTLRARIYVPEFAVRGVNVGQPAAMFLAGRASLVRGRVESLMPADAGLPDGLVEKQDYKGIGEPRYYVALVSVPNPSNSLRDGMSGTAKITIGRRSLAGFAAQDLADFFGRKFW
jgi:putative peptide zinc metalloprotease protein